MLLHTHYLPDSTCIAAEDSARQRRAHLASVRETGGMDVKERSLFDRQSGFQPSIC